VPRLLDHSKSSVEVEAKFRAPLALDRLGSLLSIVMEESVLYKVMPVRIFTPILDVVHSIQLLLGELLLLLFGNI
jgi:hypothetical protein